MKTNTEHDEKACWACKRILVGKNRLGLCDECINRYGSGAITLGIGITTLGGAVWRNKGKIINGATNVIKHIKF